MKQNNDGSVINTTSLDSKGEEYVGFHQKEEKDSNPNGSMEELRALDFKMRKSKKGLKSEHDALRLPILRRKRRDNRELSKATLHEKTRAKSNAYTQKPIASKNKDTVHQESEAGDDNNVKRKDDIGTLKSQPSVRLDKYGFIMNLDENGNLQNSARFILPGGASTPSFDLYSTYSALREEERKQQEKKKKTLEKINKKQSKKITISRNLRREKKWNAMMNDWKDPKSRKKKKLRRRLRKGVPNAVRGQAWVYLLGVKSKIQVEQIGHYAELVRRSSGNYTGVETVNEVEVQVTNNSNHSIADGILVQQNSLVEVIERDISRTFPRHHMFFTHSEYDSSDDNKSIPSLEYNSSYDVSSENGDKAVLNELDEIENKSSQMEMLIKQSEDLNDWFSSQKSTNSNKKNDSDLSNENGKYDNTNNSIIEKNDESRGKGLSMQASKQLSRVLEHIETGNIPCHKNLSCNQIATNKIKKLTERSSEIPKILSSIPNNRSNPSHTSSGPKNGSRKGKKVDYAMEKGGQASLRRVLRAYNIYDAEVGYCQGMNFITAMFITYMSEEEAFWMLVAVMNESPCKMRGLFGEGMSEAHQVLFVAEKLIYLYNPKLANHLEEEGIHITMYATQWLLTLFTSSFPFDLVTRVWDCFLAEGWKVPYRVMLALLEQATPDLLNLHFEEILGYIRELPLKVNGEKVMDDAFKIPLRWKQIHKFAKDYLKKDQK